jgi:integrase
MRQENMGDRVRVGQGEPGRLIVRFPYSVERVEKVKTIRGRRWNPIEKFWTVPDTAEMPERLRALFAEEEADVKTSPALEGPEAAATPAPVQAPSGSILERVQEAVRVRHYSPRTAEIYVAWIHRFIAYHGGRGVEDMGEEEIEKFLSSLATDSHVSASTQNQALNALLFLYRQVLGREVDYLDGMVRAKMPIRLPVVLTQDEVRKVLGGMSGSPRLMAMLLYGAGLRLMECCTLRVKDVDFSKSQLLIRAGKGNKDRYTMLPEAA